MLRTANNKERSRRDLRALLASPAILHHHRSTAKVRGRLDALQNAPVDGQTLSNIDGQ